MITQDWQWEPIDQQLASLIAAGEPTQENQPLIDAIRILSHQVRQGDVCLLLADYAGQQIEGYTTPALPEWLAILESSSAVATSGATTPLILDDSKRLYFQRYWQYEQQLATALRDRVLNQPAVLQAALSVDSDKITDLLQEQTLSEQQKQAIVRAIRFPISIITGGPGTGKTTTIAFLIKILYQLNPDSCIALAAPTGKAATQIQQAISNTVNLSSDRLQASTIHRLLGYRPNSVNFRHHADNPLPYDTVIIDETSMIDLALMSKLVNAVKTDARLILLGDADQLVSVETGAVFGELCYNPEQSVLKNCITRLQQSYRFAEHPGIGKLADAVNHGDSDTALTLLESEQYPEISWLQPEITLLDEFFIKHITDRFKAKLEPQQRLEANNQFQLLCAHRRGRWGVDGLNQYIEGFLRKQNFISGQGHYYNGKPIIISCNNYQLNLFNGDIGLLAESESGELKAYFSKPDTGIRTISPARLPAYQTAWALTVHQSQGSEFEHVLLVLPEEISPVLSRELVYTAITRARKSISIIGTRCILENAISTRIQRQSGIAARLSNR
ncbi:MAG: exodeoxyribonuclease V subunit alpha [Methylococcales bacterium]